MINDRNLTMLTDFYEITMANGYLSNSMENTVVYFDMFFRKIPDKGGFVLMAGLHQLVDYLKNLKFEEEDIEYLSSLGFDEKFLEYLRNFNFSCDVWAVDEGTPIFPGEPIITVRGPLLQAQFIETMVLLCINYQSLIATKANKIVRAAEGRDVLEFGSRRAHSFDAAIYGGRAAYIGGCSATSNTLCGRHFGIPVSGTMAHSWVQMFDTELDAFTAYAKKYPDDCTLLVDTYHTIESGIPHAIETFKNVLVPGGHRPKAVRIDSGDITYLSKKARKMLDDAGFPDCKIVASNALDEYIIRDMLMQGAAVDLFGVGERLITSATSPVLGGVYKLSAIEKDGEIIPKIKLSDNVAKISTPDYKKVWRLFCRESGKAIADLITCHDEEVDDTKPLEIFDPDYTWKKKTVTNFVARPLLKKIFENGKYIAKSPTIEDIRNYCSEQIDTMWEEVLRFENPHNYYVDLSQKLWDKKQHMIQRF